MKFSFERLEFLDFSLAALAGCLATYSLGMALHTPNLGYIFMAIIVAGTLVSYGLHHWLGRKLVLPAGILYSLVAVGSFWFRAELNTLLPDEGIPPELLTAGALAWMLCLGSFFLWRDATLIFQAVPTIALFGLIGAWDTFTAAPFAFFGFLLCFATLFARTHGRLMMLQADEAGFDEGWRHEGSQEIPSIERFLGSLKSGPWRWMAGPEWALASALAVVLLSLLGAPVLQKSMQGVVGNVKINVPQAKGANTPDIRSDAFRTGKSASTTTIGNGPRKLENIVLFRTNLTEPTYLRSHTYDRYLARGWAMVPGWQSRDEFIAAVQDSGSWLNRQLSSAAQGVRVTFRVEFERMVDDSLPIPGLPYDMGNGQTTRIRPDLTVELSAPERRVLFSVRVPPMVTPEKAGTDLPDVYANKDGSTNIRTRVEAFARKAVAGAKNDFEKATKIKEAIERQVVYDLEAPPVPAGSDPVEYFLFESKRGYCDLFASAMAVCARAVGLPARYVTGFFPVHNETDRRGSLLVHESEAHAWAEIFFEGAGWVPFDATEGAPDVGRATANEPFAESVAGKTTIVLLIGLGLAFGPYLIKKLIDSRRPLADPVRHELGKSYEAFAKRLEYLTGKVRRPSHSPEEFLALVRPLLGDAGDDAERLTGLFVAALYSKNTVDVNALQRDVRAFRATHSRPKGMTPINPPASKASIG